MGNTNNLKIKLDQFSKVNFYLHELSGAKLFCLLQEVIPSKQIILTF